MRDTQQTDVLYPRSAAVGGTHAFLDWLTSQRRSYSVGFGILAAASAANDESVTNWFKIVDKLAKDPSWNGLTRRRHEDFHRWRRFV